MTHCWPGVYFRRKTSAGRAYLQIVESRRDGDQVAMESMTNVSFSFNISVLMIGCSGVPAP
jgi:hypothetical protein